MNLLENEPVRRVEKFIRLFDQNQKVIVKGCASVIVPTWAYLILVSRVAQVANKIYYGEPRYAVKIFDKSKI